MLGGHRLEHLEPAGLVALLDPASYERPDVVVLDGVVVVQHVGEPLPPRGERPPRVVVLDGSQADGVAEPVEVAAERVVHEVHAGLVVRSVGHVGLAGEADLSHATSVGAGAWAAPVPHL